MNIDKLKADLDFERTKRKDLTYELQQLKQELQLEKDNVAELNELLIAIKQENEESKEKLAKQDSQLRTIKSDELCHVEILTKRDKEITKLEQKLEKIKEIAIDCCSNTCDYKWCKSSEENDNCEYFKILQIIESEGE